MPLPASPRPAGSAPAARRAGRSRLAARAVRWACVLALLAAPASAQIGEPVVDVVVEQDGQVVTDTIVLRLAGALVGRPLEMTEVRETIARLMSLNRFEDVQPHAEPAPGGIRIRYVLVPLRPVDRVEFRGPLGLPERDLRRLVRERFGESPGAARMDEVAAALRSFYVARGYPEARVVPSIEETQVPPRASMVMRIESGPRARVTSVLVQQIDPGEVALPGLPEIRVGQPYDANAIQRQLDAYVARMRARGYYEARATHQVQFGPDGLTAVVTVTVERGLRVRVEFAGDALPAGERDRLVPVRAEGSADEDLLEDSARAIREYLFARGYKDASADYTRTEMGDELTVTFEVDRGPRHLVEEVRFAGNAAVADAELEELLRLRPGEPFVQRTLDGGVAQMLAAYRLRGFVSAEVTPTVAVLPPDTARDGVRPVEVTVAIAEGPRTLVESVTFQGVEGVDEMHLERLMALVPGQPFSEVALRADRDRLELEYRNLGYERVSVAPEVQLADGDTAAHLRIRIDEGPQILVDHIIIVGNERTNTGTIERELLLSPGDPLGFSDLIESRSRLMALGLFRRVQIDALAHAAGPRRDVLVQVEEAPVYSLGFGGGLEGGFRLRAQPDGTTAERLEIAPRGFFEIGRRNLWGTTRSINLFTRVSLRARDVGVGDPFDLPAVETSYGFNEYRILTTYREPRILGTPADVLVSGIFDQAVRTSFNFVTRELRAEMGWRASRRYSLLARYAVRSTELFDERFTEAEKPLIDRVFPQVRTSKFAGAVLRDTRDDLLDPTRGTFVSVDADLAARAIGSEVGFVKSYVQAFSFYRLPVVRRTVFAVGARIGAAHGFPRPVPDVGPDGEPTIQILQDLPASERFFAGGDTSVRGFSLDRLGSEETISPVTGFPTGGNAVLVLNTELRVAMFGAFQGVAFFDAGNVFARPTALDLTELRPAAGAGIWYRSPVGPIRLDLGFNLQPRELVPGQRERGYVVHLALGPAF